MSKQVFTSVVTLAVGLFASTTFASDPPAKGATAGTIRYVANMGVLISSGEKSVLIDALFRRGEPAYDSVDEKTRELMEVAKPPFDKVGIALATHFHKEHFDPMSVSRFMRRDRSAMFVSTAAVIEQLDTEAAKFDAYRDRVRTIEPEEESSIEFSHAGISVDVLRLSHGGSLFADVVNLGFIVHLGGKRVLHVGDAVLDATTISAIEAVAPGVDVICVPYGWLTSYDGQVLLKKKLKPKKIIALHFATGEAEVRGRVIHKYFPDAVIMSHAGETTPF